MVTASLETSKTNSQGNSDRSACLFCIGQPRTAGHPHVPTCHTNAIIPGNQGECETPTSAAPILMLQNALFCVRRAKKPEWFWSEPIGGAARPIQDQD